MPHSSHVAGGFQPGYAASGAGGSYAGVGAGPVYGGATQAYPHCGSGYPQQYPVSAPYDYHGLPSRGQACYIGKRSYAAKAARPDYFKDKSLSDGANLFVFHIPNDMTNEDMYKLFQPHGNILTARIMTERDTGRGRGFGFVSYDDVESAANAIHFLNGFQMQGKRLKVQYKQVKENEAYIRGQGRFSLPGHSAPVQKYARHPPPRQHRPSQPPVGFVPVQEPVQKSVPVKDYAGPPEPPRRHELTYPSSS